MPVSPLTSTSTRPQLPPSSPINRDNLLLRFQPDGSAVLTSRGGFPPNTTMLWDTASALGGYAGKTDAQGNVELALDAKRGEVLSLALYDPQGKCSKVVGVLEPGFPPVPPELDLHIGSLKPLDGQGASAGEALLHLQVDRFETGSRLEIVNVSTNPAATFERDAKTLMFDTVAGTPQNILSTAGSEVGVVGGRALAQLQVREWNELRVRSVDSQGHASASVRVVVEADGKFMFGSPFPIQAEGIELPPGNYELE